VNKIVLDASALLAVLNGEPGAEKLTAQLLNTGTICTVNLAEVQSKLVDRGLNPDEAWDAARGAVPDAVDFTPEHARVAGTLIAQTRPLSLSPADRACLALGLELKAPIYTADRSWKNLKLGVRIHVIR
jgi:ribonuclease VapC